MNKKGALVINKETGSILNYNQMIKSNYARQKGTYCPCCTIRYNSPLCRAAATKSLCAHGRRGFFTVAPSHTLQHRESLNEGTK